MAWTIEIKQTAERQLAKLDPPTRNRIVRFLRDRISGCSNPRYKGKTLKGNLTGLWRYRVGDYRVICHLQDNIVTVMVLEIRDRKEVYKKPLM